MTAKKSDGGGSCSTARDAEVRLCTEISPERYRCSAPGPDSTSISSEGGIRVNALLIVWLAPLLSVWLVPPRSDDSIASEWSPLLPPLP